MQSTTINSLGSNQFMMMSTERYMNDNLNVAARHNKHLLEQSIGPGDTLSSFGPADPLINTTSHWL